jgi:hypothetical protein
MSMLVKKSVLLVKAETTFGTDPTPSETLNSIIVSDAEIKENIEAVERNAHWAYLGTIPSLKGMQTAEVTFKVDLYGSGSMNTAPRVGALLKACGLAETVNSGSNVTYQPTSSSIGSCTIYFWKDGRRYIVTGCRGDMKVTFDAGKFATAEFTMSGAYSAPAVVANPTCTYESTAKTPPVCLSANFTYNAKTTLITKSVELALGNTLAKKVSLSAASGVTGFEITERKSTVTIDPECQVETSYTFRSDQLTTTRALSVVATRASGNIITLNVPYFNLTKIEYADREGILVEKLTGEAVDSSGDDALTLVFS